MKPIHYVPLVLLALAACGGPSEEDVLTPDRIRASESAPELPDIQLSENPEPPPAPPAPEEPVLNEIDNSMVDNAVDVDPLAPAGGGPIPAAFIGRWGQSSNDCRPGDTMGGLVVGGDSLRARESVGRLVEVLADYPDRFAGIFEYDGIEREEELILTGGGNTLVRAAGGQRQAFRRCSVATPTG